MKVAITTAVLLVLLGTTTSSFARQEKGQEEHSQGAKPAEQQHAQQQSKPAQQQHTQERSKPAQQQHVQQQAKPAEQQHAQQQAEQKRRQQPAAEENRRLDKASVRPSHGAPADAFSLITIRYAATPVPIGQLTPVPPWPQ